MQCKYALFGLDLHLDFFETGSLASWSAAGWDAKTPCSSSLIEGPAAATGWFKAGACFGDMGRDSGSTYKYEMKSSVPRLLLRRRTQSAAFRSLRRRRTSRRRWTRPTCWMLTLKKYYDVHQRTEDVAPGAGASYSSQVATPVAPCFGLRCITEMRLRFPWNVALTKHKAQVEIIF